MTNKTFFANGIEYIVQPIYYRENSFYIAPIIPANKNQKNWENGYDWIKKYYGCFDFDMYGKRFICHLDEAVANNALPKEIISFLRGEK